MPDAPSRHRLAGSANPGRRARGGYAVIEGCAYRRGTLVCERVLVTLEVDDERVGLTPAERRRVSVRFVEGLDGALRKELWQLAQRRGGFARRLAERIAPIDVAMGDGVGATLVVEGLAPSAVRVPGLRLEEVEFVARQPAAIAGGSARGD